MVIGVDPGTTTGLCVVAVEPKWLEGAGSAAWESMGAALRGRAAYQVGRHAKVWEDDRGRSAQREATAMDELLLPILAQGQPLVHGSEEWASPGRKEEHFYSVLDGNGPGADLGMVDAQEILQVRQIAGLAANYETAALVIEDFSLRTANKSRETLSPARLRLAIQTEEILHGAGRTAYLQQPSEAMTTAPDEALKRARLWFSGMQHANDAARHVALFLRKARIDPQLRAQAWPKSFRY